MPIDLERLDHLCRGLGATDTLGVQVGDVRRIIDEIRELRADRERLDWLENGGQLARFPEGIGHEKRWFVVFHRGTPGPLMVSDARHSENYPTARAAIDAARVPLLAEERKTNDAK